MDRPPSDSESLNPLVLRFGALGDTVVLTAMLRDLTVRWGVPCDVVTGAGPQRRVLAGLDSVREVFALPSRRTPYPLAPPQWALVRWLRARRSAPTYLFDPLPKVGWLADRAGLPRSRSVSVRDLPRRLDEHTLDYQRRRGSAVPEAWAGDAAPPPVGPPGRVEMVAEAPPDQWPADAYAWQRWHRLDAVPPEAVLDAWWRLEARTLRQEDGRGPGSPRDPPPKTP